MIIHTKDSERNKDHILIAHAVLNGSGVKHIPGYCVIETESINNIGLLSGEKDFGICFNPVFPPKRHEVSDEIFKFMIEEEASHIVWLSSKVFEFDIFKFAWVLAHEFGHVMQHAGLRNNLANLRREISDMRRMPEFCRFPPSLMTVNEIDSDLFSYNVCRKIFTEDEFMLNFPHTAIERCPCSSYPKFLESLVASHVEI